MYEDKRKNRIDINFKSLIIKMAILLVALFVVIWLISVVNKRGKTTNPSNLDMNLQLMKTAAEEYFTGSRLPEKTNAKKKITLEEMFDSKLLVEFKDQDNKACELADSYAEATKISDDSYTIKVKLVCGDASDYVINTIKVDNIDIDNNIPDIDDNNGNDDNINNVVNNPVQDDNNNGNTNTNINNSNGNKKPNNSTDVVKPNISTSKPITSVTTTKPSTSTSKPSTTTKPNTSTNTNTCSYGNMEYTSNYPLAYMFPGNCAQNPNSINANYNNNATSIGGAEYKKLVSEISSLASRTNTRLFVSSPKYRLVYNKTGKGVVGYTIELEARQYIGTYTSKVIYEYHIDQNGNRKVLIDNRSGITYNQGTVSNNTVANKATSVNLNTSSLKLDTGDTYTLNATVTGNTNSKVVWSSNNTYVATVNSNGVVTANRAGDARITATVDGKSSSVMVSVNKTEFKLDSNRKIINVGDTFKIAYNTNMSGNVTWSSSNNSIATVNSNGVVTGKARGTVTITGRIGNNSSSVIVTVKEVSNSNTSSSSSSTTNYYINVLDDSEFTIFMGNTYKLNVSTNIKTLTYKSSNSSIATVNSSGVITPKKVGWTNITVSGNGISKSVKVYCSELAFLNN